MAQFVHTVRFVLGMAMLIAGVALVYPLLALFSAGSAGAGDGDPAVSAGPGIATGPTAGLPFAALHGGTHAIPDARIAPSWSEGPVVPQAAAAAAVPPPPPPPLPPSRLEFSSAPPSLDGAYRSALDIPPPPLLDVHAPPPLAGGWSAHDVGRAMNAAAVHPAAADAPATYVIRDGDDLTGIAIRVYGHAAAASAIWEANRGRLTDPQLLPIGLALQMPPSWTVPAAGAAGGVRSGAIEPTFTGAAHGAAAPVVESAGAAAGTAPGHHWLGEPPIAGPAPVAVPVAQQPSSPPVAIRPAKVTVAAGDSLDAIALRFYGDRAAAARILQANRDRLRSPELIVPGMELRLP